MANFRIEYALELWPNVVKCPRWQLVKCVRVDNLAERAAEHAPVQMPLVEGSAFRVYGSAFVKHFTEQRGLEVQTRQLGFVFGIE